jgi:glycosyltransferase involved in cell wall biosynthesis
LMRRPRLLAKFAPLGFGLLAPWCLGALPGLVGYLRQQQPDVMLSGLSYPNITAILARELAGVSTRVVISERNTPSLKAAGAKRKWRALNTLVPAFYPMADVISAVSSGVASDLAEFAGIPANHVRVTYNPVVTPNLENLAREVPNHRWLEGDGPAVILGIGALRRQKNFALLVRAFAKLRGKLGARLIILGEGPQRGELEALVAALGLRDDVDLVGFEENPFSYLARASLLVLSSDFEGLPGVLVQAMACGCPVVSTDCPTGPREILLDGELGSLVPTGDVDSMAEAMLAALELPISAERLQERAEFFSVANATERYLALLRPPGRS